MKKFKNFLVLFSVFSQLLFSQKINEKEFGEIRKSYEKKSIDDISAMSDVKLYIQKAKREKNFEKLIQGYRDGRQFDYNHKMNYADSALSVSTKHGTKDDVSKDYLSRGIIYYFYQKKYKSALNDYLKSYEYSKGTSNQYHRYKVVYHLGIVKSHLGYYDEALLHFQDCLKFYKSKFNYRLHVNEQFNYKKGYFNSLHQLAVINRYLKNYSKSDSLAHLGYQMTDNDKDFLLENSYFLKTKGILDFYHKKFDEAETNLKKSLPVLLKRCDYAWASVVYFYLGKIAEDQNNISQALYYYNQVDSIFVRHKIVVPEVLNGYKFLIVYYKENDVHKQLYYTRQLLIVDCILTKDFSYLSSKMHKDFDRQTLLEEKEEIENRSNRKMRIALLFLFTAFIVLCFFLVRYVKDKKIKNQYDLLQKRIADGSYHVHNLSQENEDEELSTRKTYLTPEITEDVKKKLEKFESELQFKKKGLTQKSIAVKLGTNSHYISVYINENKGINFTKYIAELRISYITNLLNTNTKYLNYTIDALAEECGISGRQNFSKVFFEINGIRPADYIKNRKKDLGIS